MTNTEKVKRIRDITFAPIKNINTALKDTNGDVDAAIKLLIERNDANVKDMQNRMAGNNIVYSYVHNNKIGAMIVLACQTDFVAKNELFLGLAKDICMHIVSAPIRPEYISEADVQIGPFTPLGMLENQWLGEILNKPKNVQEKILAGKKAKYLTEVCLLNQKFVKDDTKTIKQVIDGVSAAVGEKIELKKFIRVSADVTNT